MIIVAFDFRTKCAVTDRIETAYIVDDLHAAFAFRTKRYVHARVGNTCIYLKPGNTVRGGGGGGGGGTQFPRELNPVNWFCTTRELGPGDCIP